MVVGPDGWERRPPASSGGAPPWPPERYQHLPPAVPTRVRRSSTTLQALSIAVLADDVIWAVATTVMHQWHHLGAHASTTISGLFVGAFLGVFAVFQFQVTIKGAPQLPAGTDRRNDAALTALLTCFALAPLAILAAGAGVAFPPYGLGVWLQTTWCRLFEARHAVTVWDGSGWFRRAKTPYLVEPRSAVTSARPLDGGGRVTP